MARTCRLGYQVSVAGFLALALFGSNFGISSTTAAPKKAVWRKAVSKAQKTLNAQLVKAAWNGNVNEMKALVHRGAQINNVDNPAHDPYSAYHISPLMEAAWTGRLEAAKWLLDRGANPNLQSDFQQTALIFATMNDDIDMMKLLVARGADTAPRDYIGRSAINYAVSNFSKPAVLILKRAGEKLDGVSVQRGLRFAIEDCAEYDFSTPSDLKDVREGCKFVDWLLSNGADVNSRGFQEFGDSKTILMIACGAPHGREHDYAECPSIVKVLLKHKARLNLRDDEGKTALAYARWCENKKIIGFLKRAGAKN